MQIHTCSRARHVGCAEPKCSTRFRKTKGTEVCFPDQTADDALFSSQMCVSLSLSYAHSLFLTVSLTYIYIYDICWSGIGFQGVPCGRHLMCLLTWRLEERITEAGKMEGRTSDGGKEEDSFLPLVSWRNKIQRRGAVGHADTGIVKFTRCCQRENCFFPPSS